MLCTWATRKVNYNSNVKRLSLVIFFLIFNDDNFIDDLNGRSRRAQENHMRFHLTIRFHLFLRTVLFKRILNSSRGCKRDGTMNLKMYSDYANAIQYCIPLD